jgi:ATP-binding cassette, subfamily B, bacterial PglK
METFKKLLFLLNSHERKRLVFLLIMITIGALLDMIGVASILPFMAVLTNPSLVETNLALNIMFQSSYIFGVENSQQFLFALGVLVFVTLVITLIFKALTFYVQVRFIQMCEYSIAKRLVEGYLNQAYSWFLNRNSAELGKNILSEVGAIIGYGINPFLGFISKGLVTIAIISLLIIADPKLTLIVGFSLGISYIIIFYSIRNYLKKLGKVRFEKNQLRFLAISEAFGATKEVKVGGLEQIYVKRFSDPAHSFAQAQASSSTIAQLPRFFLEAIGFGGIILLILYMMLKTGNFNNALPIISLYVFAGYRLLPALQILYSSFAQFTFVGPALDKLYYDIINLKPSDENQDQGVLSLNKNITLKNIHYSYPNSSRTTIKDISINIPVKSTVGLVGTTGSGKTTIVDIIMGLLEAQKGTLEIDGKIITKQNSRSWQRSIGYVPQHIYLSDDTIANNIAFGVDHKNINQAAVERAAKVANLHGFVVEELSNQYQTKIGERGVRLSGGQRQRIGIARALYHDPKLLILDEATSALDNQTEQVVMDAVNNLGKKDITIILIAHRLNTVKNCDVVFKLEKGQVTDQGSFDKIINSNKNLSSFS